MASGMVSGLVLIGCNNQPNTVESVGPTILMTLAPMPGNQWPPNTPDLVDNRLSVFATATGPAGGAQIQWFPTESNPPDYDWRAAFAPGDNSGIRYLAVNVFFFSDCGGQVSSAYPESLEPGSQVFGSQSDPVLAQPPVYILELSPQVTGTYYCSGQTGYFKRAFLIKIGNVDGLNYGP